MIERIFFSIGPVRDAHEWKILSCYHRNHKMAEWTVRYELSSCDPSTTNEINSKFRLLIASTQATPGRAHKLAHCWLR